MYWCDLSIVGSEYKAILKIHLMNKTVIDIVLDTCYSPLKCSIFTYHNELTVIKHSLCILDEHNTHSIQMDH